MHQMNERQELSSALSDFTRAPYVVLTDCCTHALEVCLRLTKPKHITIPCNTYLSVVMTFVKLQIPYSFTSHKWIGEYNLEQSNIWDSARLLKPRMYRKNSLQCLSFGHTKPVDNKRGGAILLDNHEQYMALEKMCYDGRDLSITPWETQKKFNLGFHYNMPLEHAQNIKKLLDDYIQVGNFEPVFQSYPDCSKIKIKDSFDKV